MAAKREDLEADVAEAPCPPIELITENGFSIVRLDEASAADPSWFGEYRFMVRDPRGSELEIAVSIAPEAVNEIIWRSRGRISARSSYWICIAERRLAEYLWQNGKCPPDARLHLDLLTPRDFNTARRWKAD